MKKSFHETVDLQRIERARQTLRGVIQETPVVTSRGVDHLAGRPVGLKAENLQRTGSFKIRGAYNALCHLGSEERERGVVTASAGNHAQGVALAASLLGIPATVFMPRFASISKVEATRGYGAEVRLEGESFDEAVAAARAWQEAHAALFIPAFDNDDVIAGQGTVGLEVLEQWPDLECLVVPVGGGGLLAGTAVAVKAIRPEVRIVGVQAEGAPAAVDAWRAKRLRRGTASPPKPPQRWGGLGGLAGHPETIADGIAIKSPSERTLHYLRRYVDDMVTVPDWEIADAVLFLLQRTKLLVEPAGAAAVAALAAGRIPGSAPAAAILSGGNIDAKLLSDLIERGMQRAGRYLHFFTSVHDRPGRLAALLREIAGEGGNVISLMHNRTSPQVPLGETGVDLLVEVRDAGHGEHLLASLSEKGYRLQQIPGL